MGVCVRAEYPRVLVFLFIFSCVCVLVSRVDGLGESPAACPVLTPPINFTIKARSQGELQRFTGKVSAPRLWIFNKILIKQHSLKMHTVRRPLRGFGVRARRRMA